MADSYYKGREKREFFRYRYEKPIHFTVIKPSGSKDTLSRLFDVVSKDLSASGMLFTAPRPPELSSIIVLDLDYRATRVCQEIEERAMIVNDKLLGKVVRIEHNDDDSYDVGVAFIKQSDSLSENIKKLVR
jgi:hypothetical protein